MTEPRMTRDNLGDIAPRILALFRLGCDTYALARRFWMREYAVERMLHIAMAMERLRRGHDNT